MWLVEEKQGRWLAFPPYLFCPRGLVCQPPPLSAEGFHVIGVSGLVTRHTPILHACFIDLPLVPLLLAAWRPPSGWL